MKDYGSLRGQKIITNETRQKISNATKGKKVSKEICRKLSEARKNNDAVAQANRDMCRIHEGKTVVEWAEQLNCNLSTIRNHLYKYGNLDHIGTNKNKKILYRGLTVKEWASQLDCGVDRIHYHIKKHNNLDKLVKKRLTKTSK